jgi:hypothetical protein
MNTDISVQTGKQVLSSSLESQEPLKPKPSLGLKFFTIVVPLLNFGFKHLLMFTMAIAGAGIHPVQISKAVGTLIGIILFPAIIVGLFQIGKRYRNPRSRWRIFLYASLFLLFASVVRVVGDLGSVA